MSHEQQKQLPGILQAMAQNDWDKALELAKQLSEETSDLKNVNNFAAISLIQGNLDEVRAISLRSFGSVLRIPGRPMPKCPCCQLKTGEASLRHRL